VDVALFGRMLADLPSVNQDAACQVAHAISTHRVEREFDYFTAVDDKGDADETGAGMIGQVEFNSATLYRYAVLDLHKLLANLQGDRELALSAVAAFTRPWCGPFSRTAGRPQPAGVRGRVPAPRRAVEPGQRLRAAGSAARRPR
jgi:CRISPR-associated protein Cas7/Cse4/CasC subtype I-E